MTREQQSRLVKQRLYAQGITVKQWAVNHGFSAHEVYKVLSGERKGLYGRGFEIAQKLGIVATTDHHNQPNP
ncbi:phage-associated protein, BcepMu gp16 family [Moraxella caprae]|uniref:Phage-associated protein, BcepMu gp16 family n=1 Tax=Moraxella caprae TaxID=90240 RepID=A0A378R0M5_9GAMM|nr:hypothetical protein [Moraxella caprae]STZ08578.1 phage-associated protein, BcepMu gp16 family [Moraxella caprae]